AAPRRFSGGRPERLCRTSSLRWRVSARAGRRWRGSRGYGRWSWVSRMYPTLEASAHGAGFALALCRPSPSFRMGTGDSRGCRALATLGRNGSCARVTWPLVHAHGNTHDDRGADRKSRRLNASTARLRVPGGGRFGLWAPLAGFVPSRSAALPRDVRGAPLTEGHRGGSRLRAAQGEHDGAAHLHVEQREHCHGGPARFCARGCSWEGGDHRAGDGGPGGGPPYERNRYGV